jgi:hypothetical protein
MVLGIDVGFAHNVLYFVYPRLESSVMEDRRAGIGRVVFHFVAEAVGDDGVVDFPCIFATRHTFSQDAGTARPDGTGAELNVSARSLAEIHQVPSTADGHG